jgi:hypothetical protein
MPLSEGVGLLASRSSISIPILHLRTIGGIVPCVLALEIDDVAQILLCWCYWVGTMLIAISTIPIAIPLAIMVISITSML